MKKGMMMKKKVRQIVWYAALFFVFLFSLNVFDATAQNWPSGIHDPSGIVKCGNRYWVFGTGDGIHAKYSYDLVTWENGPTPFNISKYDSGGETIVASATYPSWINNYVHGAKDPNGNPVFHGGFWAPDIIYMNNKYYLYYSCSEWGTMTSTIGCVVNETLNPEEPNYEWKDAGFLGIWSYQPGLALNAIDPALFRGHGRIWMAYGSFNEQGIVVTEIDSVTGKPLTTAGNLPGKSIANSWTGPCSTCYGEGEGGSVIFHDGWYYLFYNKGGCCNGIASSYYMVMGRSVSPKGPFKDKSGKAMRVVGSPSGGTVVFKHDDSRGLEDRYYGPGHPGFYSENGTHYMSFHYYDPNGYYPSAEANYMGGPTQGLAFLKWGNDGWPEISMEFLEKGFYTLRNAETGKVLDVYNHELVDGALAFQYAQSAEILTQAWMFTPLGTGEYSIRNFADTTKYLEATGTNNEQLLKITSNYTGAINQKFRLVQSPNGKLIIYPSVSDKIMEVPNGTGSDYLVRLNDNNNDDSQRWIAEPYSGSGVGITQARNTGIAIFPNPAGDNLQINSVEPVVIEIYNSAGTKVKSLKNPELNVPIDVRGFSKGIYIVKVRSEDGIVIDKFVKE